MPERKITNDVLFTEILFIKDKVKRIEEHLKELNGQVARNTNFKNKVLGAIIVISSSVTILAAKIFIGG